MPLPLGERDLWIPGLIKPLGEAMFVEFTGTITASESDTFSTTLSAAIGFLWMGIAIDSAGEFTYKVHPSGFDDFSHDGDEIHGNTFSGKGIAQAINDPVDLPAAYYLPGNTTIQVFVTDLSTSDNLVFITLVGVKVRRRSQFELDLVEGMRYLGL